MKKSFAFVLLIVCSLCAFSQDSSAIIATDTTSSTIVLKKKQPQKRKTIPKDTFSMLGATPVRDTLVNHDLIVSAKESRPGISLFRRQKGSSFLELNPFLAFKNPMRYSITIKKWQGKEVIFYSIITLLIFFALVKNGFGRYVDDLIKTYFRTGINQKQAKEQLLQNPLPSLLLNLFFVLSIGMFLALLLQYFRLGLDFNFWLLYLYCILGLVSIYLVKFISLKFIGWIFQVSPSTDSYIFIVFTTNKIIGIALLPFLVILAFTYGLITEAAMSLSLMVVCGLIAYRFFLSYISIRGQIRISFFHFVLYLLAFEVIPLLLINKLLFSFVGETS
jgi:hypothetical protein